jgi:hypothetical protein
MEPLAGGAEADPFVERSGPAPPGDPENRRPREAASACLVEQGLHGVTADTATLCARVDVEPPDATSKKGISFSGSKEPMMKPRTSAPRKIRRGQTISGFT